VPLATYKDLCLDATRTLHWAGFVRSVSYWRQLAEPDEVEDGAARDEAHRRLHLSGGLDGTGLLDGMLTPVAHATVGAALDRIEGELFAADRAEARDRLGDLATAANLARTPAQRRHDALVEMAERATTAPADGLRPRPLVTVLVGLETFTGRVCELADGTVVAPGLVAGLLDRAVVERAVFDGPDRVLAVGQARLFTGAVRRAIEIRDRHCTHPGCTVPAHRCDVDHIVPAAEGGPTSQANGRLLCPPHHRWRHRHTAADPPIHDSPGAGGQADLPSPCALEESGDEPGPDLDLTRELTLARLFSAAA
jgi:Rieske Fe-S protein